MSSVVSGLGGTFWIDAVASGMAVALSGLFVGLAIVGSLLDNLGAYVLKATGLTVDFTGFRVPIIGKFPSGSFITC